MYIDDFKKFKHHYNVAVNIERQREGEHGRCAQSAEPEQAFELYSNARRNSYPLLFHHFMSEAQGEPTKGELSVVRKVNKKNKTHHFRLLGRPSWCREKIEFLGSNAMQSVAWVVSHSERELRYDQNTQLENWDLHSNDAWLLGGVHGYQAFCTASPLNKYNVFLEPQKSVLSMAGRELLGLILAGYKLHQNATFGEVLVCHSALLADNLDLIQYQRAVANIENGSDSDGRKMLSNICKRANLVLAG